MESWLVLPERVLHCRLRSLIETEGPVFSAAGRGASGQPSATGNASVQRLHPRSLSWGKPESNMRSVGVYSGLLPWPQLIVTEALS